jgi:hypothetical protein
MTGRPIAEMTLAPDAEGEQVPSRKSGLMTPLIWRHRGVIGVNQGHIGVT